MAKSCYKKVICSGFPFGRYWQLKNHPIVFDILSAGDLPTECLSEAAGSTGPSGKD